MLKNRLSRIASFVQLLVVLVFLFCSLGVVYIGQNARTISKHSFQLPTQFQGLIVVDARDEISQLVKEVLFSGNADDLISRLKGKFSERSDSRTYGINWLQPAYYFKTSFQGKELQGLIVSIADENAWNAEINKLFGNVSAAMRVGNSGMVVQSSQLNREALYQFIQAHQLDEATFVRQEKVDGLVAWSGSSEGVKSNFDVISDANNLQLRGSLTFASLNDIGELHFRLKPNKFHLTTDLMLAQLQDSLHKVLGKELPISGISMNYDGLTVVEEGNSFLPIPQADLILGFNTTMKIDSILALIPSWTWMNDKQSIKIGGATFYVKQLDDFTIYIGQTENPEMETVQAKIGLDASGSLKSLLSVQGNSFVRMALGMNPAFVTLRDLSSKTENFDLKVTMKEKLKMQVDGSLKFKNQKSATLSLLEMAVNKAL